MIGFHNTIKHIFKLKRKAGFYCDQIKLINLFVHLYKLYPNEVYFLFY